MKRLPIIHPYVNICKLSQPALDKLGFTIREIHLDRTQKGWLRLYITWRAKKDAYKVKYPSDGGTIGGSGGGQEHDGIQFEFPQVPAPFGRGKKRQPDHKASMEVGIYIKTGRRLKPPRLQYRYQFYDCIKHGVLVWFSPRDWNNGRGDVSLFKWGLP